MTEPHTWPLRTDDRPVVVRKLYWSDRVDGGESDYERTDGEPASGLASANLISSESSVPGSTLHLPVLDLDVPHALIPSSTPGHSHLYLDVACTWTDYVTMLRAMARCGVLQEGYVEASIARGFTAVRPPWVRK